MKNHVIKSEKVLNEGACRVLCYMEPNCVSINLGPLEGETHKCELNNATDEDQFFTFLKNEPSYTYLAIEVTLSKIFILFWYIHDSVHIPSFNNSSLSDRPLAECAWSKNVHQTSSNKLSSSFSPCLRLL